VKASSSSHYDVHLPNDSSLEEELPLVHVFDATFQKEKDLNRRVPFLTEDGVRLYAHRLKEKEIVGIKSFVSVLEQLDFHDGVFIEELGNLRPKMRRKHLQDLANSMLFSHRYDLGIPLALDFKFLLGVEVEEPLVQLVGKLVHLSHLSNDPLSVCDVHVSLLDGYHLVKLLPHRRSQQLRRGPKATRRYMCTWKFPQEV